MSSRCYQHAKSIDPDVIAAVERNWAGRRAAFKCCAEWAKRYGADRYYLGRGGHRISSLILDEKPTGAGQWVWNRRRDGYLPGARNPLRKEMEELGFDDEKVPGLPQIVISRDSYLLQPAPFIVNDAAWVIYGRVPGEGYGLGEQWVEVKASEAYAAKEAWEETHTLKDDR